jgi:DNA-binding NtrC family response regulator
MALRTRILLIEDDSALRASVQGLLEDDGYEVEPAASAAEALEVLDRDAQFAAVISAVSENVHPADILERIRDTKPDMPVVWIGGDTLAAPPVPPAVDVVRLPLDPEQLRLRVREATGPAEDLAAPSAIDERFDALVGDSHAMASLRDAIARVAAVDSTVLVLGETGTGKDLVARLIHRASPRRDRPFVTIACGAPEELLEGDLFGQERVGFAGAARAGRLEQADGGTVYLDEVADLPLALQPRILRFLHDRTVRRVGGLRDRVVDVRLIAATQRSLPEAIAAGEFRSDLFFRLAAVPLELPPLRTHIDDVLPLCAHLVTKLARRLGKPPKEVASDTAAALARHSFPGNVRELENLLERALVLGAGDERTQLLEITDLPEYVVAAQAPSSASLPLEGGFARLHELQVGMERDLIARAVRRWPELSNTQIAHRLGTNRRVLELRMKEYGISKRAR